MIRRPPRSTLDRSSAASDVYKRQDDVPRLRREDDDPRQGGRHAEPLGEIGQQHQPGDCLLYTSPSPRDRTRSRMPSSA